MFPNLFSTSPSVWAGLFGAMVAIPILIHLINLMRHRTVKWAAMDFLLKSHKKHRNWVWLKQFLLLLARITAMVLALLMLSQIGCEDDRVAKLLGGSTTHHYVILDDSFSMTDRDPTGRAFDRAKATLSKIAARAKNRRNQVFSLIRFSEAGSNLDAAVDATVNAELVDSRFDLRIENLKGELEVTSMSPSPLDALKLVADLIEEKPNENAIVYVLSDFRQKDWDPPLALEPQFARMETMGAAIELINCTKTENLNLSISRLAPMGNVRVAETPLMMEFEIKNNSSRVVENVQVELESIEFPQAEGRRPESMAGKTTRLPTAFVDRIEPGKTAKQAFPVYFAQTGSHVVSARLDDDAVADDNVRFASVRIKSSAKVLMIDDVDQAESELLSLVMNPGGTTGLESTFEPKSFLRDAALERLNEFDVILLLDIDSLDELAVKNLEAFVQRGGGVAFFLGPNINPEFYREQLYRGGDGVFPLPLLKEFEVPERLESDTADIQPQDHPMFTAALSAKNSFLGLVQIKKVWQPMIEWDANDDRSVDVLATIRGLNGLPLVLEKQFGQGRCIAVLTTAGPAWNNWSTTPTFVPTALFMQDYLAQGKYLESERIVGQFDSMRVSSQSFQRQAVRLFRREMDESVAGEPADMVRQEGTNEWLLAPTQVSDAGISETWLTTVEGEVEIRREAYNVDASEGNLLPMTDQRLLSQLSIARPTMVAWDQFNPEPKIKPASSLHQMLLLFLVVALVAEQVLAYLTNYHR